MGRVPILACRKMYGSELAEIKVFGTKLEKSNLIDGHASSGEDIDTVLHVHCWHDSEAFNSKFAYIEGKYKDRKPISNSRNNSTNPHISI